MLSQWERWVFYYELALKPHPDIAPDFPLETALQHLEELRMVGRAEDRIEGGRKVIRLRDLRLFPVQQVAALLFGYGDPDVPDPVFENMQTGEIRSIAKGAGEGGSYAAHMLVSLQPDQIRGTTYTCVLEDVPGLGKTKIKPFLTKLMKMAAEEHPEAYTFNDPNNNPRAFRPMAELDVHASQSLENDLRDGHLIGFELVRRTRADVDYDEEGFTREETQTVRLSVSRDLAGRVMDAVRAVHSKAKNDGYDSVRVRFKKIEGKQRSVLVGTAYEDAGDAMYGRCELLNEFALPLDQSCTTLREDVLRKMMALILQERRTRQPQEA